MPVVLASLSLEERALLHPGDQIILADGVTHTLGNITSDWAVSGGYTKIAAYSHTRAAEIRHRGYGTPDGTGEDPWLNLITGEPLHGNQ